MMRKVLITGASRGIGKATAESFTEAGYKVYAPGRDVLDLENENSISEFINVNKNIAFDVIINNAGINDINEIDNITDEEIYRMLSINLVAPIKIIRGFVDNMKVNNYGRIVNIGSIWAVVSKGGRSIYSATKNGIHGITNTLAVELAKYNILVNTVCPGFTMTELTEKNNSAEQIKDTCREIPLGRMAEPKEIAEVIYFLCSEKNTYLTGQKITVDGGFVAK